MVDQVTKVGGAAQAVFYGGIAGIAVVGLVTALRSWLKKRS